MTPEERDLRRALDARSGEPSPQFRARLTAALGEGRPASGLMQAVAIVAVVAITLGTVGVLLLSRGTRHIQQEAPGSETRYTVNAMLLATKSGPIRACFNNIRPLSATGCDGVDVTNVDLASMDVVPSTIPSGTVMTGTVKLVGTWDGRVLRLTEQPRVTTTVPPTKPVVQAPPKTSRKTPQEVVQEITRDYSDLGQRGIVVLGVVEYADAVRLFLAVADAKSVQYLYDKYGRLYIFGWLQPVDPATETPRPSPSPSPAPIYLPTSAQLSAPSKDVVWALVNDRFLFRSTDRGATWEQRQLPPHVGGGSPPEISFVDATSGWYFVGGVPETQCNGAGAQVWRTTDGAATWQLIAQVPWTQPQRSDSGIAYTQCKESLSFVDPTHGFLGAGDPNHKPTIYSTSDGGKTWSPSTLPDPPGFASQTGGSMLRLRLIKGFGDTLLALADPGRPPAYVFRSTDGGATWAYLATASRGSTYPTFVTASRWLVIGNDGSGLETTDAGKTWHPFSTDYAAAAGVAATFVFGDANVGYGTVRGGVERTVDGGSHWVRINTPGVVTPFPTTHSPIPTQAANWPSYASADYGYSLRYSPRWFDLGGSGHEHYFSNMKEGSAPFLLGQDGVLVGVSADCHYGTGAGRIISQASVVVDTIPSDRYFMNVVGPDGSTFVVAATVEPGGLCYRFSIFAWRQKAIEANLADFDLMLQTVRFSSRTAPVQTSP